MYIKESIIQTAHNTSFGYDSFLTWALNLAGVNAKIAQEIGRTDSTQK